MNADARIVPPGYRVSTTGCLVAAERWEHRRSEAARLVRRRLLTLAEASEHFGLPLAEITSLQ
jgi:hypothetical protein